MNGLRRSAEIGCFTFCIASIFDASPSRILFISSSEMYSCGSASTKKEIEDLVIWGINSSGLLLKIAYEVLAGEIAAEKKNYKLALSHLKKGVELESTLRYNEPPTWFYPVRQNLGAVMIEAGEFAEAEKVYLEDLEEIPENGWALYGLYQRYLFRINSKKQRML